ncbi:MAG: DUF455 family protein [Parachlamydiaceae bacterium]
MELREWAIHILSSDTLEGKLTDPGEWTDHAPGSSLYWDEPTRPPGMGFSRKTREDKLPPFQDHADPYKRALCMHRFAGHELLAVEIMAFAILAFPQAPSTFRKGLAHTLREEQGHVMLYMEQMKRLGVSFGDLPLYRHFWKHTSYIQSPIHYVSMMSLTFEMANLDFAPIYGKSFAHHGDFEAAGLMATILKDEIAHVKFGWRWLKQFKQDNDSEWDAWESTLSSTLLTPKRAKGFFIHEEPRKLAGIPQEWIAKLKAL